MSMEKNKNTTMQKQINQIKRMQQLANIINESVIIDIDENTSYQEFAKQVATILKKDYGQHNYDSFIKVLLDELQSE